MNTQPPHGGDLTGAEALFGKPESGWLDLSTGINPCPYPIDPELALNWDHLPTKGEQQTLLDTARQYYRVPSAASIVASPGTQAIIQWLPRLRNKSSVHIVGPTYAEHAYSWRAAGHDVSETSDIIDADVIVIVNPNNPTGRVFDADELTGIAAGQHAKGGWLIVDEAFSDVVPSCSAAKNTGTPGLLVLKSFGKFFGLAGARLGFLIGEPSIIAEIQSALGPWAVSGPAISAGASALSDHQWQQETLSRLKNDADRLDQLLISAGFEVLGGTPLFRLINTPDGNGLYQKLGQQGILTRKFIDHPTWIRFGIPGTPADWDRLKNALSG